jgi:hypothetical protein
MRINTLLFAGIFLAAGQLQAQNTEQPESNSPGIKYHNQFSTGVLLGGEYGLVGGSLTSVHGIAIGVWTIGVGSGIEGYERWRVIPLFGSLTCHFRGYTRNSMFLSFNVGHSYGRLLLKTIDGIDLGDTKGGSLINPMIGYQLSGNKWNLYLSAGYKRQEIAGNYGSSGSPFRYSIDERIERFMFQIGFGIR